MGGKRSKQRERLRKRDERKLRATAHSVEAMAGEMEGKVVGLVEARARLDKSAVKALRQVDLFFGELAQYKHELEEGVRAARKCAHQPITDAFHACRVLTRAALNSGGGGSGSGGMAGGGEQQEEHLRFALAGVGSARVERGRHRRNEGRGGKQQASLEVVRGSGVVESAADRCEGVCQLRIEVVKAWEVVPGAVSQSVPSLNTPRGHHAAAVTASGHVFVVGGRGRHGLLDCVEWLGDGDSWEIDSLLPEPRSQCVACCVGDTLVVAGGVLDPTRMSDAVEAVDTVGGARATLPSLPQTDVFAFGVASLEEGKVVVTGGYLGHNKFLDNAWVLEVGPDPIRQPRQSLRWEPLPSLAQARAWHGAAAGGGCIFACGGYNINPLASCEMARVVGTKATPWEHLPPLPDPLHDFGCCYGGGNVFAVGGGFEAHQLQAVLALNVRERRWAQVGELAARRYTCAAVCVGRCVLVLGGRSEEVSFLAQCEMFEF